MKLEQAIQKRFVDIITKRTNDEFSSSGHKVYANLLFYRLKDLFSKSFPRFTKLVGDEIFSKLIYDFLKHGASNPILWKVNDEFKDFVLKNSVLEIPFLEDLLYFEYLEIEMYMSDFSKEKKATYSLNNSYRLSNAVKLITLSYPVHHPDFDTNSEAFQRGEQFILLYHKEKTNEIIHEEITAFSREFLQMLKKKDSLLAHIQDIATVYELDRQEILEVYEGVLQRYVQDKILVLL